MCARAALLLALVTAACGDDPGAGPGGVQAGQGGSAGSAAGAAAPPNAGSTAAAAGTPAHASGAGGFDAGRVPLAGSGTPAGASAAGAAGSEAGSRADPPAQLRCKPRSVSAGDPTLRMHHIHFNTQDPAAAIAFVEKFFAAKPIDFCFDEASSRATRAAKTERAFFLYTKTSAPPSNMRNNRLAHVGYNRPDVAAELQRLLALDVPLADASACATAAQGTPCNTFNVQWFYVETAETTRFEIATGPGPSTMGFAHIHLVAPSYGFYEDVLGAALQDVGSNPHVGGVNMIASGRSGMLDSTIVYQDTRGAPVDHVGFSTTDLEATRARIEAAGVAVEEPISFKDEYGFRSFMVRSPEGVWLEIVEDDAFAP